MTSHHDALRTNPPLEEGQRIPHTIGDQTITYELLRPIGAHQRAWVARRLDTAEHVWVWRGPDASSTLWRDSLSRALTLNSARSEADLDKESVDGVDDALPRLFGHTEVGWPRLLPLLLLTPPAHASQLCACDIIQWAKVPTLVAIKALERLVRVLATLRKRGLALGGLKRSHLQWDEEHDALLITFMPTARPWRDEDEECWRDIRVVGDLLFEKLLGRPCPDGHALATILQDPVRMREIGLTQPGLIQILAGCVTPYGDLAYHDHAQLLEGIAQLRDELHAPLVPLVGASSTMGVSIFRKNNQDSFGFLELGHQRASRASRVLFACVADGIGGISDGERASALATRAATQAFTRAWSALGADAIARYPCDVARAITKVTSQRLAIEGELLPDHNRGGTTFCAIVLAGGRLGIAHVGDSRIYLVRQGQLIQLTRDHTLATLLDDLGPLGEEDPKPEDVRHRTISRFLTTSLELPLGHIDTFSDEALCALHAPPHERPLHCGVDIAQGDLLLLSSDGLHEELSLERIRRIALEHEHPEEIAAALTERAMEAMSRDNVTVVAVRVDCAGSR